MSSPPQKNQISDLRAQLKAQRLKRLAAAQRLREATAEAAEGTPADSKFFRLFNDQKKDNGYASAEETQIIVGYLPEADNEDVKKVIEICKKHGTKAFKIGQVVREEGVNIDGKFVLKY